MSKVRVHITVSADGYAAGPNPSLENPLGGEPYSARRPTKLA
jgi:hypothetical protein